MLIFSCIYLITDQLYIQEALIKVKSTPPNLFSIITILQNTVNSRIIRFNHINNLAAAYISNFFSLVI